MEDEDEDVVFENSPLYQHLKEAGLSDENIETVSRKDILKQNEEQAKPTPSLVAQLCKRCYNYLVCTIFKWMQQSDEVVQFYQSKMLPSLCASRVLVEEDRHFLEYFVQTEICSTSVSSQASPIRAIHTFLTVLLPCLASYYLARFCGDNSSYSVTFDLLSWLAAVIGCVYLVKGCRRYARRRQLEATSSVVTEFLDTAHNLVTLSRKALRLIQEMELVARGFTLVSQRTAVAMLDQRPSAATVRQCPELRKCLFATTRTLTLMWRETTLDLIKLLICEIDSVSHYLAGLSLEDYGPCLLCQDETELYRLTDGYSVAALKAMTELFGLHVSEFVRRLALCFSPHSQPIDQESKNPFETINVNRELVETLKANEVTLRRLYDFHRSSPQGRQPKHKISRSKTTSQTEEFYVAMHSLDLHLQSAVTRVRDLANDLETILKEDTNDKLEIEISMNEKWTAFMTGIKAELEACKGCWEEGMTRLDKSKKTVPKLSDVLNTIPQKLEPRLIPFAQDPIIEDEVFEGYTDPYEIDTEPCSWEPILSLEEKEKRKREKQEAMRLLTELRSVISLRAVDRERREQVALSRTKQGQTTLTGADNSKMHSHDESCMMGDGNSPKHKLLLQSTLAGADNSHIHSQDESCIVTDDDSRENKPLLPGVERNDGIDKQDRLDEHEESLVSELSASRNISAEDGETRPADVDGGTELVQHRGNIPHDQHCDNDGENEYSSRNESGFDSHRQTFTKVEKDMTDRTEETASETDDLELSSSEELNDRQSSELKERLSKLHGGNLGFTANVAAMAAAKSRGFGLSEQTFGDTFGDSSSEEEREEEEEEGVS